MKPTLTAFLFAFSLSGLSQKIKVDEIDKFSKQRRIETSMAIMRTGLSTHLAIHIRSVDSTCFFILNGSGLGTNVIGTDEQAIFLLDNDSTVVIYSTGVQSYEIGTGTLGSKNYYEHQYQASLKTIQQLSIHSIKSIRKYGTDSYSDIDIPEKNQDQFKKFASLFLKTFFK